MQLVGKLNIDFMSKGKLAMALSLLFVIISIGSLATRGLNFGIDFTGGYLIEVGYADAVELAPIRKVLEDNGIEDAVVQHFGTSKDVLVRLAPRQVVSEAETDSKVKNDAAQISDKILKVLSSADASASMRRVEFVGPQIGDELTEQGGMAVLVALLLTLLYIAFRFQLRFSAGAILALVHDVLITLGILSILQIDFGLPVLAALLAVIGYSLNDTIVVYDRIRENFRKIRKGTSAEIINISINNTIARTLVTSATTLIVLFALFLLGGEIIHAFAFSLIIGVLIGTYSSIFIASTTLLLLNLTRQDMMLVKKEGAELDATP